jgi:hypothetical protein
MRYGIALILSTALAALSSVICGYFANDPSRGLTTGFSQGELKIIPWLVFIFSFVSLSKKGKSSKPSVPQSQSSATEQSSEAEIKQEAKKED